MDQKIEPNGYDWMEMENTWIRLVNRGRSIRGLSEFPLLTEPVLPYSDEYLDEQDRIVPGTKERILSEVREWMNHRIMQELRQKELEELRREARRKTMRFNAILTLGAMLLVMLTTVILIMNLSGWKEHGIVIIGSTVLAFIAFAALRQTGERLQIEPNAEFIFFLTVGAILCVIERSLVPLFAFVVLLTVPVPAGLLLIDKSRAADTTN